MADTEQMSRPPRIPFKTGAVIRVDATDVKWKRLIRKDLERRYER
jgi:hypothetical protein